MGSIHEVIEAFRQLSPTNSERGTKFEQLMVRYFELDPMLSQQYEQVWRWIDWPDRKGKPDTGIDLVARERTRDRARRPLVVVLTDGRATAGPDPLRRSHIAAARLVAEGAAAVVVDCETSYVRLGLAAELAAQLRAPVLRLEQLRADALAHAVRRAA